MPTDCASFADLKNAVKVVLELVSDIGKVEARVGGSETWIDRARPKQAFWEISVTQVPEIGAAVGTQAFERPIIRIEGFMPFSYEANTEATWDALVKSVRDTLRTYPTLGNQVSGVRGRDGLLPQTRVNRVAPYSDARRELLVHHTVIEIELERFFTYSFSATLPA